MAKIETLSLEVDGILPDTRVFRERCFLLDGAALYSFKAAPALVPQGRINLHDAQLALREEERAVFITVLAESRIYRLVAESLAESADWAHALRLAVQKQNQDHKVLKMGYLKKSVLGGWGAARRQWVVLDRSELFFFAKPPEFAPDAVLPLDRGVAPAVADERPGFCFTVQGVRGAGGKSTAWTLRAPSAAARDEWLGALRAAVASAGGAATADGLALAAAAERRGWLQKESAVLRRWNPRYVELRGDRLAYFTRPGDRTHRGEYRLFERAGEAASVEASAADARTFSVTLAGGAPTLTFRADDEEHAREWVAAMRDAIGAAEQLAVTLGPATLAAAAAAAAASTPTRRGGGSMHALSLAPVGAGPCVSQGAFDDSAPRCCTPQAARWRCNALLVGGFDVTWRRVPAHGEPVVVQTEHVGVAAGTPAAGGGVAMEDVFSAYMCVAPRPP